MPDGLWPLFFVFCDFREHDVDFFVIVLVFETFAEKRFGIFILFVQIGLFRLVETFEFVVMPDQQDADAGDAEQQDEDGEGQQDSLQREDFFQVHFLSLLYMFEYLLMDG